MQKSENKCNYFQEVAKLPLLELNLLLLLGFVLFGSGSGAFPVNSLLSMTSKFGLSM